MADLDPDVVEAMLFDAACAREPLTYRQAVLRLEMTGAQMIHRLTEALEALMRRHAAAGMPQYACWVVSRGRGGLPAPGFFVLLEELGLYRGSVDGPDAHAFVAQQRQRCLADVAK